jgi:hypothetical protein
MESALHRRQAPNSIPWVQVMVTIDRPEPESLAGCNRKEKFAILLENARRHRTQLVQWIQEQELADEVARIGAPTSFNLLFIQCTPHAAAQLAHAPGVVNVAVEQEQYS